MVVWVTAFQSTATVSPAWVPLAVPLTVKPWARSALLSTLSLATLFTLRSGASVSSVQVAVLLAASETLPGSVLAASFCLTRTMPGAY